MKKDNNYDLLTEEKIKEIIKDTLYSVKDPKCNIQLWAFGYEDEHGNIKCGFLEEFDKAMKEEVKKMFTDEKDQIQKD